MSSLEEEWAKKVIGSGNPFGVISSFPYFRNYDLLVRREWDSLNFCSSHKCHNGFLFVGGGPFPLSAILLSKNYGVEVTVLDNDRSAVETSRVLVKKLGLADKIRIIFSSAEEFSNYEGFEIIILASMVGMDEAEKSDIMDCIKSRVRPKTHIVARTSESKLYPKLTKAALSGLVSLLKVKPGNGVKNSFLVLRKE